jgi:hypothetical protein
MANRFNQQSSSAKYIHKSGLDCIDYKTYNLLKGKQKSSWFIKQAKNSRAEMLQGPSSGTNRLWHFPDIFLGTLIFMVPRSGFILPALQTSFFSSTLRKYDRWSYFHL